MQYFQEKNLVEQSTGTHKQTIQDVGHLYWTSLRLIIGHDVTLMKSGPILRFKGPCACPIEQK